MSAIPNMTVFATAPGVVDLTIIVTPTGRRSGHFDARLEGGCVIVKASRQPFLDAARALIGRGADPSIILEMWHDGAVQCALRAPLGVAAALDVRETPNGPAFRPFMASQSLLAAPPIVPNEGTSFGANTNVANQ
jgi:hypothetical protein